MGENPDQVTKQDLDQISWRDVVELHSELHTYAMARDYYEMAEKAQAEGDGSRARAYSLLANCVALELAPSDIQNPLHVFMTLGTRRSASIDDIAIHDVDALIAWAPQIDVPWLRARLADIAWILKRDHVSAGLAVDAYLEAADSMAPDTHWIHARDYLERALRLSFSLGNGGKPQQQKVTAALNAVVNDQTEHTDVDLYPAHAMELLLSVGEGDAQRCKPIAEEMANRGFAHGGMGVETAEWYWRLAARWAQKLGETSEGRRLRVRAAKAWADIADQYLGEHPSYLTAANYLLRSYTALRELGESSEARQLESKLFHVQEMAVSEMREFSTTIDLRPIIEDMETRLQGVTLGRALAILVAEIVGPSRAGMTKLLESQVGSLRLEMLIASHLVVDHLGRVVGKRSDTASADSAEAPIDDELYDKSKLYRELVALGQIDTARRLIGRAFRLTEYQLIGLLTGSPFVRPGCERIYARGIMRGFEGDFISACSILVPQIESSMRYILEQQGIPSTRIDAEGVQREMDLNTLLRDVKLNEIFGEELIFDLRGLLIEPFGSNFRNRLAHGLVRDGDFYSADAIYAWWVVLKLCLYPAAVTDLGREDQESATT